MFLTFGNWLKETFKSKVPSFITFLWGVLAGIIAFIIIGIIVYLISKTKKINKRVFGIDQLEVKDEYKDIIKKQVEYYSINCRGNDIKEKLNGISKILNSLLTDISKLYYPTSSDPIFEISIDQLVDLIEYTIKRINFTLDRVLETKLSIVNKITKNSIKDKRISLFFKPKNEDEDNAEITSQKKKGLKAFFTRKVTNIGIKIGLNIADKEIMLLINDLGEDINKLYSKQPLIFKDVTKKQAKLLKYALNQEQNTQSEEDK